MKKLLTALTLSVFLTVIYASMGFAVLTDNIECSMSFEHQTFYQNDEINAEIRITNIGRSPVNLEFGENAIENFNIEVISMNNQRIEMRDNIRRLIREYEIGIEDISNNTTIATINPNDSYIKIISIDKYFNLTQSGTYIIRVNYYPEPGFPRNSVFITTNSYITLREGISDFHVVEPEETPVELEITYPDTPQDTVYQMLSARQIGDWQNFFRYFDLDRIILLYPDYAEQYIELPPSQRVFIVDRFKEYLQNSLTEEISEFRVARTIIEPEYAQVVVDVQFEFLDSYDLQFHRYARRYTYNLYLQNSRWIIYNFVVREDITY